jgi:hypothetical protein
MSKIPQIPPMPSKLSEQVPPKEIPTGPSPDKKGLPDFSLAFLLFI